jgi:hypothetical protein
LACIVDLTSWTHSFWWNRQNGPCKNKSNNNNYFAMDWVVAYRSRLLKGAEMNYGITQKECLAIVWGIKYFHTYLYGTKFTVVTDQIALSWLNHTPVQNGRLARWAIYLQEYDFNIVYRKGKHHGNVDAVSRPVLTAIAVTMVAKEHKTIEPYDDSYLLYYLTNNKHLPGASKRQTKRVLQLLDKFKFDTVSNTLFYRKSKELAYLKVPKVEDRVELMENAHLLGHFNSLSTAKRLQESYYWPKMLADVENVVSNCFTNRAKIYHHPGGIEKKKRHFN